MVLLPLEQLLKMMMMCPTLSPVWLLKRLPLLRKKKQRPNFTSLLKKKEKLISLQYLYTVVVLSYFSISWRLILGGWFFFFFWLLLPLIGNARICVELVSFLSIALFSVLIYHLLFQCRLIKSNWNAKESSL